MSLIELSPVDERQDRYDTLFRGELPYEPLPDDIEVGISGLCRITERGGRRSEDLQEHIAELPKLIDTILIEHDLRAMDDGEAIFSFVDDKSRDLVNPIVTGVFTKWEVTYSRNKLEPLLPSSDSSSRWLVIETASAVMQIIGENQQIFDLRKNKRDEDNMIKIISSWGPRFAKQWFDGTILQQWMDENEIQETEQNEWLEIFTSSIRKYFAVYNINDPLSACKDWIEGIIIGGNKNLNNSKLNKINRLGIRH